MNNSNCKTGFVAIVGRPNVGKSSILNQILQKKVSITSASAQTTRGCVMADMQGDGFTMKLVDTPGVVPKSSHLMDTLLNKTVTNWLDNASLIVLVIESRGLLAADEQIVSGIDLAKANLLVVINKIDKLQDKGKLLPIMEAVSKKLPNCPIVPVSATRRTNIDNLLAAMIAKLPFGHPMEKSLLLATPKKVIVSERIREKVFRYTSQEIPRQTAVQVFSITGKNPMVIKAAIIVDRVNHRKMLIGKGASKIKQIGTAARMDLSKLFCVRVYLDLTVLVQENWANQHQWLTEYQVFNQHNYS